MALRVIWCTEKSVWALHAHLTELITPGLTPVRMRAALTARLKAVLQTKPPSTVHTLEWPYAAVPCGFAPSRLCVDAVARMLSRSDFAILTGMTDVHATVRAHNRMAWDRQVEEGNQWTVPALPEAIAAARRGEWRVLLTPLKPAGPSTGRVLPNLHSDARSKTCSRITNR